MTSAEEAFKWIFVDEVKFVEEPIKVEEKKPKKKSPAKKISKTAEKDAVFKEIESTTVTPEELEMLTGNIEKK